VEQWGWIALSLFAVVMQTVRTAAQKHITKHLDAIGATLVRFVFGLPFAAAFLAIVMIQGNIALPALNQDFLVFSFIAAVLQVVATVLLIYLFSLRNFAVGTTYARTEAFLTALLGSLFFGEIITTGGWAAIMLSVAGVVVLTIARTEGLEGGSIFARLWSKSALVGVAAGLCFAVTSLSLRRASLSFGHDSYLFTAGMVLVSMIVIQIVITGVYIMVKSRHQFAVMAREWKLSWFIGFTSALGSIGWFTAMTLERASYVKAFGQIEFLFALVISTLFFREKTSGLELIGMVLVAGGIGLLLIVG
jgi:drug/metabolite transporter (DMT)-like permease